MLPRPVAPLFPPEIDKGIEIFKILGLDACFLPTYSGIDKP